MVDELHLQTYAKGKRKVIFAEILRELKASGYRIPARLMNAMYFGVPQSPERMIFIGVREDIWFGIPERPQDVPDGRGVQRRQDR